MLARTQRPWDPTLRRGAGGGAQPRHKTGKAADPAHVHEGASTHCPALRVVKTQTQKAEWWLPGRG